MKCINYKFLKFYNLIKCDTSCKTCSSAGPEKCSTCGGSINGLYLFTNEADPTKTTC